MLLNKNQIFQSKMKTTLVLLLCTIACVCALPNAYTDSAAEIANAFPALPEHAPVEAGAAAPAPASFISVTEPVIATEMAPAAAVPAPVSLLDTSCGGRRPCSAGGPTGRLSTRLHRHRKSKLDIALAAIKQDILVRNRQIQDEKAWVIQVRKIVDQYNRKVKRVLADIEKTKQEVKVLFRKKKQIENLKIQRALERKLKDATSDLGTLKSALQHVKTKANEFAKTKNEIKKTIISIHTQLAKLKGEKSPKKLRAIAKRFSKI